MGQAIWWVLMTFKQWGVAGIMALNMNIPLTVGSDGMSIAVTITAGLCLILLFINLVDKGGRG